MGRIPYQELNMFLTTVANAADLAVQGKADDGYRRLENGLGRAVQAEQWKKPWANALTARYQAALTQYESRWGLHA